MNRRPSLVATLCTAAVFVLALAVPLAPAVHAAPAPPSARSSSAHVIPRPGTRPYGGGGSGTPAACTQWHIVSIPQPSGADTSQLVGVSADAANDVWAVGEAFTASSELTLVEHYDGSSWSIVASPNVAGSNGDAIQSVVALAPNNVWAVGNEVQSNGPQTLVEHYDGSSWSIVASPNPTSISQLYSVAADAPNDVWAVGSSTDTTSGATSSLTEHYNGTAWSIVSAPAPASTTDAELHGVSVVSGQAFGAGFYIDSGGISHTLVEHYSGGAWSLMTTPDSGTTGSSLNTAAALSSTNVWVAGYTLDSSGNLNGGLFEHYDGTSWSVVPNGTGTLADQIIGLGSVPGTTNLWAVGGSYTTALDPLAEQWQGNAWNPATTAVAPAPDTVSDLQAVAAVSANSVWAVGYGADLVSNTGQSLIEHYAAPPAWLFCP